jgi:hypothetical protein
MWICEKCESENEDTYEACWNCSSMKPGVPSYAERSQEYLAQLAETKRQQQIMAGLLELEQQNAQRLDALLCRWEKFTDRLESLLQRHEK